MRFNLATIAYVFALFAAALAAFGGWGIIAATFVLASWGFSPRRKVAFVEWFVALIIVLALIALLLPALQATRGHTRDLYCQSQIRHSALAILMYDHGNHSLPPAMVRDEYGSPMHSWKLLVLPFLDQQATYQRFRKDEPWNSPNNSTVTSAHVDALTCPSDPTAASPSTQTNYFAIVGSQTAWPEDRGRALSEITDGLEQTILVIEAAGLNVNWAEPRDLTFDEAVALLTSDNDPRVVHVHSQHPGYFYKGHGNAIRGVNVAFANGQAAFLPLPLSREMAVALLTSNAGDVLDMDQVRRLWEPQLDHGKIVGIVAFVALALWPGVRNAWQSRPVAVHKE